jgi:hypothetical protein
VDISVDDPMLADALRYVTNSAAQPVRPHRTFHYRVSGHGPYDIFEEGDPLPQAARSDDVLEVVYHRCYQRAFHLLALGGWSLLHGALLRAGDHRLLLVGDKGAGKTTLALRLLYDGFAVEGDEAVLLRNGLVVALPRRFHLKPGVETFVPELSGCSVPLPVVTGATGKIAAFDPGEAGFPWRLDLAPVDAVVIVEPNHAGGSALTDIGPSDMVRRLLPHTRQLNAATTENAHLVKLCAQLAASGGYALRLGDLNDARNALVSLPVAARGVITT